MLVNSERNDILLYRKRNTSELHRKERRGEQSGWRVREISEVQRRERGTGEIETRMATMAIASTYSRQPFVSTERERERVQEIVNSGATFLPRRRVETIRQAWIAGCSSWVSTSHLLFLSCVDDAAREKGGAAGSQCACADEAPEHCCLPRVI